jgi:hypothetical protein
MDLMDREIIFINALNEDYFGARNIKILEIILRCE